MFEIWNCFGFFFLEKLRVLTWEPLVGSREMKDAVSAQPGNVTRSQILVSCVIFPSGTSEKPR